MSALKMKKAAENLLESGSETQEANLNTILSALLARLLKVGGAFLLALPVGAPLVYLVWQTAQADFPQVWQTLERLNILGLLGQMLGLALATLAWALAIGGPWAWLAARTDVPGRQWFRWLGPLPLAVPPYVGALAYAALLTPGGIAHTFLAQIAGVKTFKYPFPDLIHGLGGSAFVLGIFTSPYIFTSLYSALQRLDPALEEAAHSLGYGRMGVFYRVVFPLLRPALTGGSLLVFLYAWVDFGVVSLLRTPTFTTVIYNYLLGGFNISASAGLSLLLVGLVWGVLGLQQRSLGRARYVLARPQKVKLIKLSPLWKTLALSYLLMVVTLTLGLPLGVLVYEVAHFSSMGALGNFLVEQAGYTGNTLMLALISASLIIILALVVGRLRWKNPLSRSYRFLEGILQAGYAIPGTILGFSLVGISLNIVPAVYGTPLVLLLTYLILFTSPALQAVKAALGAVNPVLEEAARSLGDGPFRASLRVTVPLAWPGLVSGWLVVFVLALRELAATIILRPAGFDTLAVRIWVHTSDVGPDPKSAALALLLVLLASLSWILILRLSVMERKSNPSSV